MTTGPSETTFDDEVTAEFVAVKFTETGATGTVPAGALDFYLARGYERIGDDELITTQGDPTIGNPNTEPITVSTTGGGFDPTQNSAKAVADHLAGLDTATPEGQAEYDRIVAAEKAGQNRSTAIPS